MSQPVKKVENYEGFEQGPIRPPSEANSLLIRITRNCPWNHCSFCPVYKDTQFSLRPVEHVKRDIDGVNKFIEEIKNLINKSGNISRDEINQIASKAEPDEMPALNAALHWLSGGMKSIFLQDANSLIIKPSDFIDILLHLKNCFPWVERITSYARSHTIARIKEEDIKAMKNAGLNRIHIGLESGSDKVLEMVKKGVNKETHIKAGVRVVKAGIELSEYVMPGLGGKELSENHAIETADALNKINPHFIRLRSLAIPSNVGLYKEYSEGRFQTCTEVMKAKEILLMLENLDGITSEIKSDHILNLFEEINGKFPEDKEKMIDALRTFLTLTPEHQVIFQVGKRLGLLSRLDDLNTPLKFEQAEQACRQHGITPENVDATIEGIMRRYI